MDAGKIQEKIISEFSKSYFYDLFVYEDLQFKTLAGEIEFTDLLIQINEYIVLIQIKSRDSSATVSDKKWFDSNVIKEANKQHKGTRRYIRDNKPTLQFQNKAGEKIDISNFNKFYHITIFTNDNMENYTKYHKSGELGLYSVISYKDFQIICNELVTPLDILRYLAQRCVIMRKYDEKPVLLFTIEITEDVTAVLMGDVTEQSLLDIYVSREYINSEYKPPYYQFFKDLIQFVKVLEDRALYYYLMMVFSKFDRKKVFDFCNSLKLIQKGISDIYYVSANADYNIALMSDRILTNESKKEKAMLYLLDDALNKAVVFRVGKDGLEQPMELWDLESLRNAFS
jgi:hypothetical protein